jgi:hypothetical protein
MNHNVHLLCKMIISNKFGFILVQFLLDSNQQTFEH